MVRFTWIMYIYIFEIQDTHLNTRACQHGRLWQALVSLPRRGGDGEESVKEGEQQQRDKIPAVNKTQDFHKSLPLKRDCWTKAFQREAAVRHWKPCLCPESLLPDSQLHSSHSYGGKCSTKLTDISCSWAWKRVLPPPYSLQQVHSSVMLSCDLLTPSKAKTTTPRFSQTSQTSPSVSGQPSS